MAEIVTGMNRPGSTPPPLVWTGGLDDDCTARWAGLTLRAEWMNGVDWWWCVYDDASGEQLASSNSRHASNPCNSGDAARAAAEEFARAWLNSRP